VDHEGRAYWVAFFKRHLRTILELGDEAGIVRGESPDELDAHANACMAEFDARFDTFASTPHEFRRVTILTLDAWRDEILRRQGFVDAFIDLKNRENERMLPLLPVVCRQLDAIASEEDQLCAIIEGVFAGNIFDMGAEATAKAFLKKSPDFFETRHTLPPRPWRVDDYDALAGRILHGRPHRKAAFFIDNAGSDFLLGALPMIRWLARRGTAVVLVANERPTLNDMTIHDVDAWWPRVEQAEPSLTGLPIERVSSGTGEPLIDLSLVSAELNAATRDADLVVLEGMGRGVESNLDARLSCDRLNLAMLKDEMVARRVGGKVFDVVCAFEPRGRRWRVQRRSSSPRSSRSAGRTSTRRCSSPPSWPRRRRPSPGRGSRWRSCLSSRRR
jgi:damage-control phosphatase, subfamily II, stand-alone protein